MAGKNMFASAKGGAMAREIPLITINILLEQQKKNLLENLLLKRRNKVYQRECYAVCLSKFYHFDLPVKPVS